MIKVVKSCITVAIVGSLLLTGGIANAQITNRTLRIAYANGDGNPQHEGAKKFAELVGAKSGGKMVVKLFPNGTLGKDLAVLSSMQGGTVDMALMYTSLLVGISPECGLVQLPFLWGSAQEVFAVLDGPVGQKLHDSLEPRGVIGLGYYGFGFLHMTSNKAPFKTLEDFKGQKLRVTETPVNIDMINTLGANAVPIPYAELYNAFEQKVIDGGAQPMININFAKFYEVQKYLSLTKHMYEPQHFLFSKKTWNKLSNDEKKVVKDAYEESKNFQRELSYKLESDSLDAVKGKIAVNEVPQTEINKMREKVAPLHEKYAKEYGQDLYKEIQAEIAKYRSTHK